MALRSSDRKRVSAGCIVVHPVLSHQSRQSYPKQSRSVREQLEEIQGLARAIDLEVLDVQTPTVSRIQAGSFLGKGQRETIAQIVQACDAELVVFNYALSPVQQRNLERSWKVKVIDRTGLILEIFGARAQTKEGQLQVELAALEYQRSRLVRSWTHLERQRGGAGFMGGPGETQIELDRRIISDRIVKLKKEIEDVRRTRELGRKSRERVPFPVVALVGYTNAGKSTLFNTLSGENIFAKDLLFATLDPTLRKIQLDNGQKVILSDTVGFISDLPTDLIAAFRSTLEQTLHADVILHVIDVSSDDFEAQKEDVIQILEDLGIEYEKDLRVIEVLNKTDKLSEDVLNDLKRTAKFDERIVLVSALKDAGREVLISRISQVTASQRVERVFEIPYADGKALSWLYEHGEITTRTDLDSSVLCYINIDQSNLDTFRSRYGYQPKTGKNAKPRS